MLTGIMQVLTHHTTKKLLETKNLPPACSLAELSPQQLQG